MKKSLKISILILLFVCTISLCGCLGFVHSKTYWNGIFGYTKSNSSECCLAAINGQNNQLEAIEIPDYIDGYKVNSIFAGSAKIPYIEHDYVKKIYIGSYVESISAHAGYELFYCKNLEKIIINNIDLPVMFYGFTEVPENCNVVVSQESLEKKLEILPKRQTTYGWIYSYRVILANIEYHYNYENSPNGDYYRIDYVNCVEDHLFNFDQPNRDGYLFVGWYLEPECENRWDNSTSKIFEEELKVETYIDFNYEEVDMVTNKLQLYAKWIKN